VLAPSVSVIWTSPRNPEMTSPPISWQASGDAAAPPPGATPIPPAAPRRRHRGLWIALITVVVLLVGGAIAAAVIRLPKIIISPGSATPLDRRVVAIRGAPSYAHRGNLLFLTVKVSTRDPNLFSLLFAELDNDVDVTDRQAIIGCASYAEANDFATFEMRESQDWAKAVALRRLGYNVTTKDPRAVITAIDCKSNAVGKLALGDFIVAVDGHPVTTSDQVPPLVRAHKPGDEIRLTVRRNGQELTIPVRARERGGVAFVGIGAETSYTYAFPVDVRINTMRVGGPSAGLAFTLAIIDDLTPGDLTGGKRVAVTGKINLDGTVGPIGGARQKAAAAREAGAQVMLVPKEEFADARANAGSMKVYAVSNIDDALAALHASGGDAVTN